MPKVVKSKIERLMEQARRLKTVLEVAYGGSIEIQISKPHSRQPGVEVYQNGEPIISMTIGRMAEYVHNPALAFHPRQWENYTRSQLEASDVVRVMREYLTFFWVNPREVEVLVDHAHAKNEQIRFFGLNRRERHAVHSFS